VILPSMMRWAVVATLPVFARVFWRRKSGARKGIEAQKPLTGTAIRAIGGITGMGGGGGFQRLRSRRGGAQTPSVCRRCRSAGATAGSCEMTRPPLERIGGDEERSVLGSVLDVAHHVVGKSGREDERARLTAKDKRWLEEAG